MAIVRYCLKDKPFITLYEPCAGAGAMIFGFANAMKEKGFNYCTQLAVYATDVDFKCVYMCYLQLSLCGIPAVVTHGNTLTLEEWSRWYTPVYIMGCWDSKLNGRREKENPDNK